MNVLRHGYRCIRLFLVIQTLSLIYSGATFAKASRVGLKNQNAEAEAVKQRLATIMQQTIERARIQLKDGSYATTMPVLPSEQDSAEVKRYGHQAIEVLAAYVDSNQGLEQHLALRFLGEFTDDSALAAIRCFAEKSRLAGIRQIAVMALTGFAQDRVKPIIEQISKKDPEPEVRAAARRALATFRAHQESRK
jgi:hypothetical protein